MMGRVLLPKTIALRRLQRPLAILSSSTRWPRASTSFGHPQSTFVSSPFGQTRHLSSFDKGTLGESDYNKVSNETLESLCDYLERLGDEIDLPGYDCEFSNGVLTLRLGERGTFVINRQPPNKQIWLSSPISGPKRYDYCPQRGRWVYERETRTLDELLGEELGKLLNITVRIPR